MRTWAFLACLLAFTMGTAARETAAAGDIAGTWALNGYKPTRVPASQRILKTVEGTEPPYQPWAEKLYRQRVADSDKGEPHLPASASCLPNGIPLIMMADTAYPFQILLTPGQVTMLFEVWNMFRVIHLDQSHPKDLDPGYMGHSTARWDGDTLVIDTIGRNDKTTLDMTGMPHSESLHVIERLRRLDDKTLENLITIDDPKTYTRPWTVRMTYRAVSAHLQEFFCENNRDAPGMKSPWSTK